MKAKNLIAVVCLFVLTSGCAAQAASAVMHRSNTQIIDFILDYQEKRIVDAAEAMPATEPDLCY